MAIVLLALSTKKQKQNANCNTKNSSQGTLAGRDAVAAQRRFGRVTTVVFELAVLFRDNRLEALDTALKLGDLTLVVPVFFRNGPITE